MFEPFVMELTNFYELLAYTYGFFYICDVICIRYVQDMLINCSKC